jgi:hypothetical protein
MGAIFGRFARTMFIDWLFFIIAASEALPVFGANVV